MKLAAIDVGTNSTRLLVVDTIGSRRRDLYRSAIVTRLGEGTSGTGLMKPEAIERTLTACGEYASIMKDFGVVRVRAVATSAVRDARNSNDFVAAFRERLGFGIEVLTGDQEARIAFKGAVVQSDLVSPDETTLVVDVGGGSTEFIWGKGSRIEHFASVDIGSVRLTEALVKHDPPEESEIASVRKAIETSASGALSLAREAAVSKAVAVAGTATTLAAVKHGLELYDPEIVHGSHISQKDIEHLIERFRAVKSAERALIPGLQPGRADVIIAGSLILLDTLEWLGLGEFVISERDILDGLIGSML